MAPDHPKPNRSLSEISHLFLSEVRNRQTNGAPRPQRTPPRAHVSIDMTAEEFAQAYGAAHGEDDSPQPAASEAASVEPMPPGNTALPHVTAVIGWHLNGGQVERARELARFLAHHDQRIGLIELDAAELRLMRFEVGEPAQENQAPQTIECADPRDAAEALEEMSWDVDQWLLVLPALNIHQPDQLLKLVDRWVLLTTVDHDGIVAAYRALKGLAEGHRPHLSLAVLDAPDAAEAQRVFQKFSSVCRQFLDWALEEEVAVQAVDQVSENLTMRCYLPDDPAQARISPAQVVAEFLARVQPTAAAAESDAPAPSPAGQRSSSAPNESDGAPSERATNAAAPVEASRGNDARPSPQMTTEPLASLSTQLVGSIPVNRSNAADSVAEVIDLSGADSGAAGILDAVVRQAAGQWIQCPVHPPMLSESRLTVMRDGKLMLLAVARQGLADLQTIGQAYRWLSENRALIGMALPQLAIDAHALPRLHLLIDQADVSAQSLQPLMAQGHVSVQSYRKLRWGEKTGLLLEAA